jgi:hypothetical protein
MSLQYASFLSRHADLYTYILKNVCFLLINEHFVLCAAISIDRFRASFISLASLLVCEGGTTTQKLASECPLFSKSFGFFCDSFESHGLVPGAVLQSNRAVRCGQAYNLRPSLGVPTNFDFFRSRFRLNFAESTAIRAIMKRLRFGPKVVSFVELVISFGLSKDTVVRRS